MSSPEPTANQPVAHIGDNTGITPATAAILDICPRFRILVAGRSGVGKSSLINAVFGVDLAAVSHNMAGAADINQGIVSPDNERLVLHDSRGLETGELENLGTVKQFIASRTSSDLPLGEKVHAMWLCIETPTTNKRILETGDEELIKLCNQYNLPIIVVFTQFDTFVAEKSKGIAKRNGKSNTKMSRQELNSLAEKEATNAFKEMCVVPLSEIMGKSGDFAYIKVSVKPKFSKTLEELVTVTQDSMTKVLSAFATPAVAPVIPIVPAVVKSSGSERESSYGFRGRLKSFLPAGWRTPAESKPVRSEIQSALATRAQDNSDPFVGKSTQIALAMAQRKNVDEKIDKCIVVGRERYWRGLRSNLGLSGKALGKCLETLHYDIVKIWNFQDPNTVLLDPRFMALQLQPIGGASVDKKVFTREVCSLICTGAGVIGGLVPVAAPVVVPVGFGVAALGWLWEAYTATDQALIKLMKYIVDTTLVMERLFWLVRDSKAESGVRKVNIGLVKRAYTMYVDNDTRKLVHQEIEDYVNGKDTATHYLPSGSDHALNQIIESIQKHRYPPPPPASVSPSTSTSVENLDETWDD